jgi:hypothetical protein
MQKYEQAKKVPEQHQPWRYSGTFSILSKHNHYLVAVLQRIHQAVIVVYGYSVDHSMLPFLHMQTSF